MTPYRVSVVIPTKNRSQLLAEAIRGVRAIDGPDLEAAGDAPLDGPVAPRPPRWLTRL